MFSAIFARSAVSVLSRLQPRVFRAQGLLAHRGESHDELRVVRGAVIDDDELEIFEGLRGDRIERRRDEFGGGVRGDYDRDAGHGLQPARAQVVDLDHAHRAAARVRHGQDVEGFFGTAHDLPGDEGRGGDGGRSWGQVSGGTTVAGVG